jgi:signal transduction histidine kinase
VTQRFVRLESSRNSPGTGLGLSLVSAVARLHEATLSFEDNRPGLRATLIFHRIGDEYRRAAAAQTEVRALPEPVH